MTDPADQIRALEHQLRLAHQSRRASEHLLDGIRRAMCDAGFMEDSDPYGHADLADVIRQAAEARETAQPLCGDPGPDASDLTNPCTLPLGHEQHRDQDGCRWPVPAEPVEARTLIRNVLLYVSGCVYRMDRDYVEELTGRLWDLYRSPARPPLTPCLIDHDCPGQVRQPPHCGCEVWDRGEAHPAHDWVGAAGAGVHCNGKPPASWPVVGAESAVPLNRAAVRIVVSYVGSLVGWIDEVHGVLVDQITDAAMAKISEVEPAVCPDLPGHETHSPPCGFTGRRGPT